MYPPLKQYRQKNISKAVFVKTASVVVVDVYKNHETDTPTCDYFFLLVHKINTVAWTVITNPNLKGLNLEV